ncbi:MAG: putative porin [Candidatus Omnitrophica bacterium]|nr:putative porin [Candidatus Omnitrophota bacterium]
MRKSGVFFVLLTFFSLMILTLAPVMAGEIDILVEKLVEKGVLNHGEAAQILTKTKEEIRRQVVAGESAAVPQWAQNIKMKGDFRLRYQHEKFKNTVDDRNRGRIRFRLGAEGKVNEKLKVAAGLATGGTDPRSTNETLDNTFETPDIRLDYAYADWAAAPWLNVSAGKLNEIKKLIFRPTDLLWDSDIHPEGLSLQFFKKHSLLGSDEYLKFITNAGFWILDESGSDSSDPLMWVIQPGFEYGFADKKANLKIALAYYGFNSVKDHLLDNSKSTNTTQNAVLKYDYSCPVASFDLSVNEPFGGFIPSASVVGDYVVNPDAAKNDTGYAVGVKLGAAKVSKANDWNLTYLYRRLEKDAWLDTFSDSDSYDGKTGIKGSEVILEYGLSKNTAIALDAYWMNTIEGTSNPLRLVQLDWTMKF